LTELPEGIMDKEIESIINNTYSDVSDLIEKLEFRKACDKIVSLIEAGNKYYDDRKPWVQKKENIEEFNNTIYTCANVIANLSNLFEPIMPQTTKKLREYLGIKDAEWKQIYVKSGINLELVQPLFERINISKDN